MSLLASLPPEISSALLYSGPGSSSLVAASAAWNALAAELTSTAQGYEGITASLASEEWLGPASGAMASAVQPYVEWLITTAGQAEAAGAQAQSAAAAFETAFASVVPPPVIAANRATLAQAQATNLFGLNNGVIAQLEAQYSEFWAQNSSTLAAYGTSSQTASKLQTFAAAPQITTADAPVKQAAATAAAQAAAPSNLQSQLQNVFQQILAGNPVGTQQAVNAITNNPLSEFWFLLTGQTTLPSSLGGFLNGIQPFASFAYNAEGLPYFSVGMGNFGTQIAKSAGVLGGAAPAAAAKAIPSLGAGGQVAAGLGSGAHIGHLAVPSSWPGATAAPMVKPAAQIISEPITAGASGGGAGNLLGGMPVGAGMGGRGSAAGPRYGFKPTIMTRPMSAG